MTPEEVKNVFKNRRVFSWFKEVQVLKFGSKFQIGNKKNYIEIIIKTTPRNGVAIVFLGALSFRSAILQELAMMAKLERNLIEFSYVNQQRQMTTELISHSDGSKQRLIELNNDKTISNLIYHVY